MGALQLSQGQGDGLEMLDRFLDQEEVRVAKITGYAGTGKTTLIREIANVDGPPTVLTPTGKAALRVGEATGIYAQTIHRFLYKPGEDPKTGKPIFTLKSMWDDSMLEMKGKLVLIDEGSMVGKELWDDLMKVSRLAGFHVLVMGDLFQLPPVTMGDDPFSALQVETPFSVNLTEVIRQALDSPIIRASMILRSGRPDFEAMKLLTPKGGSRFIEHVVDGRSRGGATLCFTNARRHSINNAVRAHLGMAPDTLQAGEPILVTQNNYVLDRYNGEVLDFGGWTVPPEATPPIVVVDRFSTTSMSMSFGEGFIAHEIQSPTVEFHVDGVAVVNQPQIVRQDCIISPEQVTGKSEGAKVGNWIVRKDAKRWYRINHPDFDQIPPHLDCNYGYGLTVHKAQGSEWNEVLVVLEDSLGALKGIEKKRWLYTAITRAKTTCNYVYVSGRP